MYEYDYLIVGAGLFGATWAHQASMRGKKCLVIDKRPHIGGNIYCENIENINVHTYGAHIFHTSDKKVWDYVNSVVQFNRYTNSPIALAPDGNFYNLPFNMNTFYQIWHVKTPHEALKRLEEQREEVKCRFRKNGIINPKNLEEQALMLIGTEIYSLLIKGYTEKQWGRSCDQLPPEIIRRLPVRLTFDNNYFNDLYQGIPIGGYNCLVEGLLSGVDTRLKCDYFEYKNELASKARTIVYTGPIDQFFDYQFGPLEYRTVRFETEIHDMPNYQGNAVINYTSVDVPFTRIIEHKHFESLNQEDVYSNPKTVISREYSTEWELGMEPFYPINDTRNNNIYSKYKGLIKDLPKTIDGKPRVIFGGRLAEYRYYDMAPIISQAINMFETHIMS